jgi:hypothetical protein
VQHQFAIVRFTRPVTRSQSKVRFLIVYGFHAYIYALEFENATYLDALSSFMFGLGLAITWFPSVFCGS